MLIKLKKGNVCNVFYSLFICLFIQLSYSQDNNPSINIDTKKGHNIKIGSSGFNVRIADKSWSYLHPDFRNAVHQLKPGWLRYFSGTMGDAFSSATGLYDIDYAMMFDHPKQYLKGYRFTEIKGPHRIFDLYQLLGEINGKLIVTINGFTDTPEMTLELARFCKNNNIEVATWQFCNEPYFYVPHRDRFWWNDGYDYAVKMKPHADAIKQVYPEAFLALNNTWDGIWGFFKEINEYQKKEGAYWNVFSKHSYAPHVGNKESIEEAYKRANTKLIEATSKDAMQEIEDNTWSEVPMVITEFGVWNAPLNGIYSSIYNIEYVMRQLQHVNTWYVGAHEVSSKYGPKKNINDKIEEAYTDRVSLNTDIIPTGIDKTLEGKAFEIYHEVTNNSNFIFNSTISNEFVAPGLKNNNEIGCFSQAYRGINGYDYLVFTNRTKETKQFAITIDEIPLNKEIEVSYIAAESLNIENTEILNVVNVNGQINIPPFSLSVAKWRSEFVPEPAKPTIYNAEIFDSGVKLTWGKVENVERYTVFYGEDLDNLNQKVDVKDNLRQSLEIDDLKKDAVYYFRMIAENRHGKSRFSNQVSIKNSTPNTPEIFKASKRNRTATVFWKSVPNSNGYKLKYVDLNTEQETIIDANNVFGFRVKGLLYDVEYKFSVAAYNGLGTGAFSKPIDLVLSGKVPLSPRNVSAIRGNDGDVSVKWVEQDFILPETTYTVYRGEELHVYKKIASGVKTPFYKDTSTQKDKTYYYTVKAETSVGLSNFYPNTATLIGEDKDSLISISEVVKKKKGYLVKVKFKNILLDGDYSYGVKIENISYLTVEEQLIKGRGISFNSRTFEVFIPDSELVKKSRYAVKAYVKTKDKSFFSNSTNEKIKTD